MAKMDEATRKRVRAGRLLLAGKTPAQAAKAVGVARQTAYTWKARLDEGGIDALRSMVTGRPAQLDVGQLTALRGALLQGAMAHDFGTELWTLKRVRVLASARTAIPRCKPASRRAGPTRSALNRPASPRICAPSATSNSIAAGQGLGTCSSRRP